MHQSREDEHCMFILVYVSWYCVILIGCEWYACMLNVILTVIIPRNFIECILTSFIYMFLYQPICRWFSSWVWRVIIIVCVMEDGANGHFECLYWFYVLSELKSKIGLFWNNSSDIVTLGLRLFCYVLYLALNRIITPYCYDFNLNFYFEVKSWEYYVGVTPLSYFLIFLNDFIKK